MLYYTSTNGQRDTRASYFFISQSKAEVKAGDQNAKAKADGLETRYVVAECERDDSIEAKDIR